MVLLREPSCPSWFMSSLTPPGSSAFFRELHPYFFVFADLSRGRLPLPSAAFDDELFVGNGHLHRPVLGHHLLAQTHLPTLDAIFVGAKHLAAKLNAALSGIRVRDVAGGRCRSCCRCRALQPAGLIECLKKVGFPS
jgi:hypothetical protein